MRRGEEREREEKKGLTEKREDARGGNEIRVFTAAERAFKYGFGSRRWSSGLRSIKRTIRCVLE